MQINNAAEKALAADQIRTLDRLIDNLTDSTTYERTVMLFGAAQADEEIRNLKNVIATLKADIQRYEESQELR